MNTERKSEKALVSTTSMAYQFLLAANRYLEESREKLGYLDPGALKIYREAITVVNQEARQTLEIQNALFGKKPTTSQ